MTNINPPSAPLSASDPARSHRVDMTGVVIAVIFIAIAALSITGIPWWRPSIDWPWLGAGAIAAAGLILVISSIPWRRASGR